MTPKIGKTLLISALLSILLISPQTSSATSHYIMPPDPPPQGVIDRLRSFHIAFNQQSPQGVLQSFIQDDDPDGPPDFDWTVHSVGRDNIAQQLTDFFAMFPGGFFTEICIAAWQFDLEEGIGEILLVSVFVVDGERVELYEVFLMVRRGADWPIVSGDIEGRVDAVECLIPLPINTVGGVAVSTSKLAVAAPYLVIVGLIAGLTVVSVNMKRKD